MRRVLKVTSKGRITLPKEVLSLLGVGPGDLISLECPPGSRVVIAAARDPLSIDDFFGCLQARSTTTLTIEAMNEIIAERWSGRR